MSIIKINIKVKESYKNITNLKTTFGLDRLDKKRMLPLMIKWVHRPTSLKSLAVSEKIMT